MKISWFTGGDVHLYIEKMLERNFIFECAPNMTKIRYCEKVNHQPVHNPFGTTYKDQWKTLGTATLNRWAKEFKEQNAFVDKKEILFVVKNLMPEKELDMFLHPPHKDGTRLRVKKVL